ncbi:coiled-coil domain-containing protein 83 isoform X2 [Tympanuchus pallidicinctus]|uniref:coiled-coil domain-containing protein 83 isoform X2 n=1 Tax=Tympanuchus pallidicinctus TaxID=109042 RepID=UPI0022871AFE|nr:coiled-coil domain-containing protein 83 isoform X2 [Tympanuchus pallidicinctus]
MEEKVKQEEQSAEESAFLEALLEFQIERKEAAIDKVLFDLKQVEKKNKEYNERNDNLKEKQQAHIRRILRRIEEKEREKDAKEVVTRDDVEELLKDKWQYAKDKEQILKDLRFQTEETDQRLSVRQSERDYWLDYKNVGSRTDANKIKNLKKDIKEVKDDFQRSSEYYRNALKAVKEENATLVEMYMKKNKEQAPENAVRYLDKSSCREIEENEWLKEEVKLYRKEVRDLKASVQLLEEENISLVRKLMDNKIQNLRVPSLMDTAEVKALRTNNEQH